MTERFELLERIGRGAMGTVWKARDTGSGEVVALKILHEHLAEDEVLVERFQREAEATRRIDSPCVARSLGMGRRDGRPFLVMEYVEGASLRERLKDGARYEWTEARPVLRQVAAGLDAAHRLGVIHRDVKPSNVIVSDDGGARLVDFGIAQIEDRTALTGSRTSMGTPGYMAPEGPKDARSDLYGLGCIAYEMLAGRPVFEAESQHELILMHLRESPDLSRVPSEARPLVGWLLKKKPGERPQSAAVVAAILEGTASVPGRRPALPPRWRRIGLGLGGATLAAVAVVVPLFLFDGGDAHEPPAESLATQSATVDAPPPGLSPAPTNATRMATATVRGTTASPTPTPTNREASSSPAAETRTPGGSTPASSADLKIDGLDYRIVSTLEPQPDGTFHSFEFAIRLVNLGESLTCESGATLWATAGTQVQDWDWQILAVNVHAILPGSETIFVTTGHLNYTSMLLQDLRFFLVSIDPCPGDGSIGNNVFAVPIDRTLPGAAEQRTTPPDAPSDLSASRVYRDCPIDATDCVPESISLIYLDNALDESGFEFRSLEWPDLTARFPMAARWETGYIGYDVPVDVPGRICIVVVAYYQYSSRTEKLYSAPSNEVCVD
jgi:serine/threonine-protein kinase